MAKVTEIECRNLEKETQEKAGKIFEILEEKGLFAQEFTGLFKLFNELFQNRKLREHQETAWHIKEGRWHWWDTICFSWRDSRVLNGMFISLSTNTITFLACSWSNLLPQIRNITEQIRKDSNFKVKIITF